MTTPEPVIRPDDADTNLETWRRRTMNAFLVVTSVVMVPMLVATAFSSFLSWEYRLFRLAMGLGILSITLLRGLDHRVRGWILMLISYAHCVVSLGTMGLVGAGRIVLLATPLWAMVLIGTRSGFVSAGLSVVIYTLFYVLTDLGVLQGWISVPDNPTDTEFWLLQGLTLMFALLPLIAVLSRFLSLQIRTLQAERLARLELEQAVARRTAAHDALEREMAERQRLEREITQISDQERQLFGSEIHDGLCQQLTAALLNCTAIERELAKRGPKETARLAPLRQLLEEVIDDAYDIAKGLCPVDLNPEALAPALEHLASRTRTMADVACEFHKTGDIALPNSQDAYHLHRIALEAVNNAVKHANANRIIVQLEGRPADIVLSVRDDGKGLPTGSPNPQGMGLRIMAYRAHMIGGTLTLERGPHGGTIMTCQVPRTNRSITEEKV